MAKTKQQKEEAIAQLTDGMKNAKAAVFANFQGLKVSESEELRQLCREKGIRVLASKKTLVKRALADAGFDVDIKVFEGGVAAFFGEEDEIAPAQTVAKFAKDHEIVSIFGGILDGEFIDSAKVVALSTLPTKEQLLGQLASMFNAPVSGIANVLSANLRGMANVLKAVQEQKA